MHPNPDHTYFALANTAWHSFSYAFPFGTLKSMPAFSTACLEVSFGFSKLRTFI